MKKKPTRGKILGLQCLSFFIALAPVAVIFIINWERYTSSLGGKWSLFGCGGIAIILFVLIILNKLKMPSFFVFSIIMTVICWILEPVIIDSKWLWSATALGTGIDFIFFQPAIKKLKRDFERTKQAKESAETTLEVLKSSDLFNGRT